MSDSETRTLFVVFGKMLITALCLFGTACSAFIVYCIANTWDSAWPQGGAVIIPFVILTVLLWWPRTR